MNSYYPEGTLSRFDGVNGKYFDTIYEVCIIHYARLKFSSSLHNNSSKRLIINRK